MNSVVLFALSTFVICSVFAFDVRRTRNAGVSCFDYQTLCDGTLCIPYWKQCNGRYECQDQTDEHPSLCTRNRTCGHDQFSCGETGQCIKSEWRCDKDLDCSNGADERNCESIVCEEGQFKCTDTGSCIPGRYVCDFQNDCSDGSDERDCGSNHVTCSRQQFACNDGPCIPRDWVCDGDNDCSDNSDEENCT